MKNRTNPTFSDVENDIIATWSEIIKLRSNVIDWLFVMFTVTNSSCMTTGIMAHEELVCHDVMTGCSITVYICNRPPLLVADTGETSTVGLWVDCIDDETRNMVLSHPAIEEINRLYVNLLSLIKEREFLKRLS